MVSEWPEVSLTELYEIRSGLSKPAKDFGTGYPFLAFKDVFKNFFVPDSLSQLVQSSPKEQKSCSVKRGDVFLTRTSETMHELGMSCVALKDYEHATFNGFTKRLRPKAGVHVIPEYAGYYLRSPKFRNEMLAFSTMSTRASLNNEMISRLKMGTPPISEQKAIAWILKNLDDRIELNRRMNETLEAMAQALFKSWFVDFDPVIDNGLASGKEIPVEFSDRAAARAALGDKRQPLPAEIRTLFPNEFIESTELGWIPKGWEVGVVGDVLSRLKVKKRYKKKDVADYGMTPVYEQGANLLLGYHDGEAEIEASIEAPAFIFGDHTCVTKLSCEPFSISENVIPLKGKKYPTIWVYYAIQGKQSFEEYRRHWMELIIKPVVLPPVELGSKYNKIIKDCSLKEMAISHQQPILANLRDTLLPKLLSGELRIPEAGKMVEELAL
ncbi:MAG: restriction endonuclease subunit S [Desulfocapsa sp.]|nr:restriction endonuclease subunit S [Desulfocapsa sp.]